MPKDYELQIQICAHTNLSQSDLTEMEQAVGVTVPSSEPAAVVSGIVEEERDRDEIPSTMVISAKGSDGGLTFVFHAKKFVEGDPQCIEMRGAGDEGTMKWITGAEAEKLSGRAAMKASHDSLYHHLSWCPDILLVMGTLPDADTGSAHAAVTSACSSHSQNWKKSMITTWRGEQMNMGSFLTLAKLKVASGHPQQSAAEASGGHQSAHGGGGRNPGGAPSMLVLLQADIRKAFSTIKPMVKGASQGGGRPGSASGSKPGSKSESMPATGGRTPGSTEVASPGGPAVDGGGLAEDGGGLAEDGEGPAQRPEADSPPPRIPQVPRRQQPKRASTTRKRHRRGSASETDEDSGGWPGSSSKDRDSEGSGEDEGGDDGDQGGRRNSKRPHHHNADSDGIRGVNPGLLHAIQCITSKVTWQRFNGLGGFRSLKAYEGSHFHVDFLKVLML